MSASIARRLGAFTLVLLVSACGSGAESENAAIEGLRARVVEIRALASARQPEEVAAKLTELRALVDDLDASGEVSDGTADEIRVAADAISAQLALITTTTTTTVPPTTQTTPTAPDKHGKDDDKPDDEDEKHGKKDD